jgi:hypothetical protein
LLVHLNMNRGSTVVKKKTGNPGYACSSLMKFKKFFSSERQLMYC